MTDHSEFTYRIEEPAAPEDVAAIERGLEAYNAQFAPPGNFTSLVIVVRDAAGAVAGGLLAVTFWGWLHLDRLWLNERARGQGLGSRLLALAEDEGRRRGCHHVFVDTMSFQALPFYLKHGYSLWGELHDFPIGHARHFLQKAIS
jgi:GNAT superfamily N-acetyltransferase